MPQYNIKDTAIPALIAQGVAPASAEALYTKHEDVVTRIFLAAIKESCTSDFPAHPPTPRDIQCGVLAIQSWAKAMVS